AYYAWPASPKSPAPCNATPPTEPESSPSSPPLPAQTDFDVHLGLAVVDTGATNVDPASAPPLRILWQAREPHRPRIDYGKRTITWPDGSMFNFHLQSGFEHEHLEKHFEPPETIHWHGRPISEVDAPNR
ncbi:MAG: hypothetical protein WBA97_11290, partial [Actinophytocola sp.]